MSLQFKARTISQSAPRNTRALQLPHCQQPGSALQLQAHAQPAVLVRPALASDAASAISLVARVFAEHEPICIAAGITEQEFLQQFEECLAGGCASGLSFVAEDQERVQIVSAALAMPYSLYMAEHDPSKQPESLMRTQPIFEALAGLPCPVEAAAYLFACATHPEHMGRGYARQLTQATEAAAAKAGYSYLVTDLTNSITQRLMLEQLGFQELQRVRCDAIESMGSIPCTECAIRAVKQLAQ